MDKLVAKLSNHVALERGDIDAIERAFSRDVRLLDDRMPIIEAGEKPRAIHVLLDGWAVREVAVAAGRRQIVSILVAGDVVDFNAFMMERADMDVRTVGRASVANIDRTALSRLNQESSRVGQALWWETMVGASTQREWSANIAARRAEPRIANLLCNLFARMMLVGGVEGNAMACPLTQGDLANACGLTQEHLNRTLRGLRASGMVEIRPGVIHLPEPERLAAIADFSPAHLHCANGDLFFAVKRDAAPTEDVSLVLASAV
ncbi:Crp/Fnr family transcriptional regulator [Sphingomonas sp. AX6]|uniref:Crp/Fnr family transcriptional regulator n=1 Tax=Sphingomonas sp. AX6 TaxID=2653171 RepID=UPI00135730A8|nr:Crp/Fnr family transcriptional regulator [Sphingomonas sp. AX6]